jgi:hypothetical protein
MTLTTVTSEALQLKLRQLLPSQQGFGDDISASNTIIPIIDLTSAAEGSEVPEFLQRAYAFGSQTAFSANNSTVVIANTPGFYEIIYGFSIITAPSDISVGFSMTDGAATKILFQITTDASGISNYIGGAPDPFTVFLPAGISISALSTNAGAFLTGSIRQTADLNGTLVQPSGFTPS